METKSSQAAQAVASLTNDEEAANKVRKWSTQARENAAWYQLKNLVITTA